MEEEYSTRIKARNIYSIVTDNPYVHHISYRIENKMCKRIDHKSMIPIYIIAAHTLNYFCLKTSLAIMAEYSA